MWVWCQQLVWGGGSGVPHSVCVYMCVVRVCGFVGMQVVELLLNKNKRNRSCRMCVRGFLKGGAESVCCLAF